MAKPQAGPSRQRPTVLDSLQHLPGIEDPERLAFLYANILPLKERNPASYKTVVAWWHQLLLDITTRNSEDSLVLHASDQLLASLTSSESGRPLSLGGVLSELASGPKEVLIRLDEFLNATAPLARRHQQSWAAWTASNAVARPLWWALGQLSLVDRAQNQAGSQAAAALWDKFKGDWVVVELVERECHKLFDAMHAQRPSSLDCLHSVDSFRTQFCPHLSPLDVRVLLKYLSRDERVLLYDPRSKVVKWLPPNTESEGAYISESDRGIVQLKSTKLSLEEQISQLDSRVQQLQQRTSDLVKQNQMERAKLLLRQKKGLQELLVKRQGSLSTLESVWLGIETATGDAEILRAYESASATLRDVLKAPEFQRIDQITDQLAESMADQKDVEEAVSASAVTGDSVDEAELMQELDQMASQQKQEQSTKDQQAYQSQHMVDLPPAPSAPIGRQQQPPQIDPGRTPQPAT